jgi:hypothetical protein
LIISKGALERQAALLRNPNNLGSQFRELFDQIQKLRAMEREAKAWREGPHRRRSRGVLEQGDFSEIVAILQNGQPSRDAGVVPDDLDLTAYDDVEAIAGVVLIHNYPVLRKLFGNE